VRAIRVVQEAFRTLARRPLRSGLVVIGVSVGVGALLIAEAVAERGRLDAVNEIATMGANVVIVSADASRNRGGRARTSDDVSTLTIRDAREVAYSVPGVLSHASEYRGTVPVKIGSLARQASVAGVDASYATLREAPMARGRFFSTAEATSALRVVVLGAQLAQDLDGSVDPVGDNLWIRGIPFRIVGVLPQRGTGLDAFDEDGVAFVPLRTAQRRLFQVDHVQRVFFRIDESRTNLTEAATAIAALLRERHHSVRGSPILNADDFRVDTQLRLVEMRQTSALRLRAFEVGTGLLLLAVGAGGTFALQQLTVRERLTEVGVRRALGATRNNVFFQFLTESSAASVAGGAVGVCIARIAAYVTKVEFSRDLVLAVYGACVFSCVTAACVPVWRVVRKQPADALRAS
jgi:ABC-type antimicrobial peptide transport system permease subunit